MSIIVIVTLIYHRHKPTDLIYINFFKYTFTFMHICVQTTRMFHNFDWCQNLSVSMKIMT
jgi:hypothetical protein